MIAKYAAVIGVHHSNLRYLRFIAPVNMQLFGHLPLKP